MNIGQHAYFAPSKGGPGVQKFSDAQKKLNWFLLGQKKEEEIRGNTVYIVVLNSLVNKYSLPVRLL